MKKSTAIKLSKLVKEFTIYTDKTLTLKERFIRGRNINVQTIKAINNVTLEIKKGDTVALVGDNGSGKSTLLKLITKILYPTKGTIETQGKVTSLIELGAGFHQDFTGRENIYFNASIFGMSKKEIDRRIDEIIDYAELGEYIDSPIRMYSSGMYMRLAFSVAIHVDADIILIDEILSVGDQQFQDKCFETLSRLAYSNKTVIIASHDLPKVKKICNKAIWLKKGEVVMDGTCEAVIKAYSKSCKR